MKPTYDELVAALKTINKLHPLGDAVYDVRASNGGDDVGGEPFTGNSWEHPTVIAYGEACSVVERAIAP